MIYKDEPEDWKDLEIKVNAILSECGMNSQRNADITTVRGEVNVDILAIDSASLPKIIYICECKHWNSPIPKTIIHAFRTVVQDYGAHVGIIISKNGFQSGAFDAATMANIELLNWFEFQELFLERWKENRYQMLKPLLEDVFEYYDYLSAPIGNAISGNSDRMEEWGSLLKKHGAIADANPYTRIGGMRPWPPSLPANIITFDDLENEISETFKDYHSLYDFIEKRGNQALSEFRQFVSKYRTGPVTE